MKKYSWIINATEEEIKSLLRACDKANIHELGFRKVRPIPNTEWFTPELKLNFLKKDCKRHDR